MHFLTYQVRLALRPSTFVHALIEMLIWISRMNIAIIANRISFASTRVMISEKLATQSFQLAKDMEPMQQNVNLYPTAFAEHPAQS